MRSKREGNKRREEHCDRHPRTGTGMIRKENKIHYNRSWKRQDVYLSDKTKISTQRPGCLFQSTYTFLRINRHKCINVLDIFSQICKTLFDRDIKQQVFRLVYVSLQHFS